MRLQKPLTILLLILFYTISQHAFANTTLQDSIPKFNKEAFAASLQELAPKEFARLFAQQYTQDSIKSMLGVDHIKTNMLPSENLEAQFWGYIGLAEWENDKTNFKASIGYVNKATGIAKILNNPDLLLANYMFQGDFYYYYGKYRESMESYLNAIKYLKEEKYIGQKLAISKNIALLKIEVGDNKGAIDLLEATLKILEKDHKGKFKGLEISLYIALTKSSMRAEEYKKALYYGHKGIELSNLNKDEDAKAYLYNYLGETNIALGNYTKASELLDEAWKKAYEMESARSQLPFINLNLAKLYYHNGNYKKAIDILEIIEAEEQKKNTNFFSLEDMYKYLGKSYKAIDTKKSLYYFEKANEVYNRNDKQQNEIGVDIIKKYDRQALKEELNKAEKTSKKTKTVLYVSILLAVIVVIGLISFYKRREKDNQRKFTAILKNLEEEKEEILEKVDQVAKATKKEIKQLTENGVKETDAKEVEIIDETKERLLKKLQSFEAKESYLSKHSSLNEVAKKLKTNTSYLSKLVNAHKGKSFTAYITDLRVNYAIKRLKNDKKFRSYTIDSIAQEIGFNRSESFSRAFKNKTGLYPSYFIKNLDNQNIE